MNSVIYQCVIRERVFLGNKYILKVVFILWSHVLWENEVPKQKGTTCSVCHQITKFWHTDDAKG